MIILNLHEGAEGYGFWGSKSEQSFWKAIWQHAPRALIMVIPFDPVIPLPGIYPKEIMRDVHKIYVQGLSL